MKCPKCGSDNKTGRKFCSKCGAILENTCPECGFKNDPEDAFCGGCGAKILESAPPKLEDMQKQLQERIPQSLADKLFAGAKQMQGEYRLVTAIFADVAGSSEMARNLPLEQYVDTMNDCLKMMVDVICIQYEGGFNRFIGDCVLAFFGAPITHENDAERAILAALDIRDGVKKLNLNVSIGINTGMTYVGEMGSDLIYSERSAWGPDVDFAKRLQDAADSGEIFVGASTYRLTKRAFDFREPASIEVKGMSARQAAYPVIRAKEHPEKLRGIEGLRARMIGREREFADLKEAADNLISGQGSVVSVIGEAGLGKSRLARELKDYMKGKDAGWYEGRSVSIGQTVSYWPFLDILRTYLNLDDAASETEVARRLRESTASLFPETYQEILPFMGHLLSVKFGGELDSKLAHFTPESIRHQTLMRLRDVFTAISRRKPLLLILEDLHWSDDLSLDLISLLMDEVATNPMMLLCIYRPEREHRCWQMRDVASRKCLDRYVEITLKKLSASDCRKLVESLLEIDNLPEATKNMIQEKSEGNPFFIEEVIRCLIERDLVYHEGDRWVARQEIVDMDVPDTIQSVLLSRVDRLEAETKYVLQCASVIGRLFRYRLLDHLAQHERGLEDHLSQLEDRDLVYEERTVPEVEYAFKHALTQEATYQGILERRRRGFHSRIADGIESLYRERIEEFYEELAHHHRLGGNSEKAIEYLLKSGMKAAGQFANREALKYFNQAEQLLSESPEPHRKEKATLYRERGAALQWIGQWTQALKEYKEALNWSDDAHDRADIYCKMGWLESQEMQNGIASIEHLEQGLRELPDDDRSVQRVQLEQRLAWPWIHGWGKSREEALALLQRSAEMAEDMGYRRELAIIYATMELDQFKLGIHSEEYGRKAISIAEDLGDLPTQAWVYRVLGTSRVWVQGERWVEQMMSYSLRAAEISERIGDVEIQSMALSRLAEAYGDLGHVDKEIETYEKMLEIASGTSSIQPLGQCRHLIAHYAERGQNDKVMPTFCRIMRTLASLDIDEESQARPLLMNPLISMFSIYGTLRGSYRIMGKGSEFPDVALNVLEELLKDVSSRPQRAWYCLQLMKLHFELGDKQSAESKAREVVSIVEDMGSPDSMTALYPAYLMLGEHEKADEMACRFLTSREATLFRWHFANCIVDAQSIYRSFGRQAAFHQLCELIQEERGERLRDIGIDQIHLKPVDRPERFQQLVFEETFDWTGEEIPEPWEWFDSIGGPSSWCIKHDPDRMEISVPKGTAWLEAPRLHQSLSGDFALETRVSGNVSEIQGGIVVWKGDKTIRLAGIRKQVISLMKWKEDRRDEWSIPGMGFFEGDSIILRLERKGSAFRAYCSADGEAWYSCGHMEAEMEDPVNVGILAWAYESTEDYCRTSFEYVRIFRE